MIAKLCPSVNEIVCYYRIVDSIVEYPYISVKKRRSFQPKQAFVDDIFSFGSNEFIKYGQQIVNIWLKSS